jgi:hypothetical protein
LLINSALFIRRKYQAEKRRNDMRPYHSLQYCAFVLIAAPVCAFAALGGGVSSIQSDQARLKSATHSVRNESTFTVHEIQAASGTMVREYVTANGTVFGVAWSGPAMPDLRQLLGPSFSEFTSSAKSQRSGHTQLLVQHPGLVVRSTGHMRAFKGSAYLPALLPQGVTAGDIL